MPSPISCTSLGNIACISWAITPVLVPDLLITFKPLPPFSALTSSSNSSKVRYSKFLILTWFILARPTELFVMFFFIRSSEVCAQAVALSPLIQVPVAVPCIHVASLPAPVLDLAIYSTLLAVPI